jgi:hypothetical protein
VVFPRAEGLRCEGKALFKLVAIVRYFGFAEGNDYFQGIDAADVNLSRGEASIYKTSKQKSLESAKRIRLLTSTPAQ